MDKIYMTFVQATTGQGGWPLERVSHAGPEAVLRRHLFPAGQPPRAAGLSATPAADPAALADAPRRNRQFGRRHPRAPRAVGASNERAVRAGADRRSRCANAGASFKRMLRRAPRRVRRRAQVSAAQPAAVAAALRQALPGRRSRRAWCCTPATAWPPGGIHDQLGGGFARYSVDAEWLVPHFEKMLYDNAQLAQLYLDAYLVSGEASLCRRRARHPRLRAARHDPSGRRLLFRRRRRQRRARRQVLLLDAAGAGEAAHARRVQGGGPLLRRHRAGQLR